MITSSAALTPREQAASCDSARWDARLKVLLANLAHGERDHVTIARLSAQVELDYHGRFLVELLQNAVDQATAAGLAGSVCRVWQRPGLLAVANQGRPFDAAGVEAVTSIALSDKRADEAIGNKGIGFKAVFEVTDDAWVVSCGPGSDLTRAPTTAIALSREVGAVSPALRGRVVAVLAERPDDERAIRDRFGRDPMDVVVDALQEQPGWRYPRAIDEEAWRECLRRLDVAPEALAGFSTMVVLPIRSGAEVLMATAVRGIADPEVLLFLDGIGRLEIDVDGDLRTVERPPDAPLAPGIALRTLRSSAGETRWWVATVRSEDPAIHDAAAELPGPGWRDVHGAEIRVALPVSGDSPPLVDGRFHIGLPTHDRTGSPFRVDARFYGTLARKSLDLGVRLNAMLRDLAVVRATDLLRWLAVAEAGQLGDVDVRTARRSVAWGLQVGTGLGFGEAVRKAMAGEAVVLRAHDDVVVPAADLALSTEKDDAVVDWLTRAVGATVLHDYGVALPDLRLVRASRKLLQELGVPHQLVRRLTSRRGERSALEEGVRRTRADREAWTVLVAWLKDRRLDEVGDQKIMPLVGDRWSTPAERPYLPLRAEPPPSEVGEAEVPTRLLSRIPILDASVLPARQALEEALVRAKEPKARAPLRVEVLVDALLPGLNEAIDAGQHAAARDLLTLALRWSRDAGAGAWREKVRWRVPTTKGAWIDARTAYFSDGWRSEQERERVPLEEVFGARGHCLRAWWGEEAAKEEVRAALAGIGVAKEPRTVGVTGALDGRRNQWRCEAPNGYPQPQWQRFVDNLAKSAEDHGRGRTWELSQCSWIDGFESPAGRALLAGWALSSQAPTCRMVSEKFSNRSPYLHFGPAQPWAQVLRADDAPCIPTHKQGPLRGRLARPSEIIRPGEHADDLRQWVPSARPGISDAALDALGVLRVADASVSWLVGRLRYVAEQIRSAPTSAERVARLLWAAINGKVAKGQHLPRELADWRVPVWKGGELTPVVLGTAASLIIMDDPYQAEVHPEWANAHCLEPDGDDWSALHRALKSALPGAPIVLASSVGVPFDVPSDIATVTPWDALAGHPRLRDLVDGVIAVLPREPNDDAARKAALGRLADAHVGWMALPSGLPAAYWIAARRLLILREGSSVATLVRELWPIVGARWRDILGRLGEAAGAPGDGLAAFQREKKLRESDIRDALKRLGYEWTESSMDVLPAESDASPGNTTVAATSGPTALAPAPTSPTGTGGPPAYSAALAPGSGAPAGVPPNGGAFTPATGAPTSRPPGCAGTAPVAESLPPIERPAGRPGSPKARSPGSDGADGQGHADRRWRPPAPDDGRYREIGHEGEVFAFRQFVASLPGFDEHCWVSTSRTRLGFAGDGNDTLGYDFRYLDVEGKLTGRPGTRCFIEVKANGGELASRFAMTRHEWEVAMDAHERGEVYVIARVSHVSTAMPRLARLLVDPPGMEAEGRLCLQAQSWWIEDRGARADDNLVLM